MKPGRAIGIGLVSALMAWGSSCGFIDPSPEPSWTDQLVADSPCYRVDLLDGLDETDSAEFLDLFGCLNYHGHFESLAPTVAALDQSLTRDGTQGSLAMASAVNAMPNAGVDVFGLAGVAVDMLQADGRPIDDVLDVVLELNYGIRADIVRTGIDLDSPTALDNGSLAPLAEVLPSVTAALLDDNLETIEWVGGLLTERETHRWIRTFGSMAESEDSVVKPVAGQLVRHLGSAIEATRSPTNDIWVGSTGESLRDASDVLVLGPRPLVPAIAPETHAILSDAIVRSRLQQVLVQREGEGILQAVPAELEWLASVDVDSRPISRGELSALSRFVRLLHDTNRPMVCSVDLWVTELDINLGNLAVTILRALADGDPDLIQGGAGLLGTILDFGITEAMLGELADSGICPAISRTVVEDLQAVDAISGPEAEALLTVFIDVLGVLRDGEQDHIEALADIASALHATGAMPPVEELVRDLAKEPLIQAIITLVPVLADPTAYGISAGTEPAANLQDALGIVAWVFAPDNGQTGYDRLAPLIQPVLAADGTWTAMYNASGVMTDPLSQTSRLLELVPPVLAIDPELQTLDALAPLLQTREVTWPLLAAVEDPEISARLLATEPDDGQQQVFLAFMGRLIARGAVDDLLGMVSLLLEGLESP